LLLGQKDQALIHIFEETLSRAERKSEHPGKTSLIQGEVGDTAEIEVQKDFQQSFANSQFSPVAVAGGEVIIRQGNIGGKAKIKVGGNFKQEYK